MCYVGTLHVSSWFCEFSLRSFGALCNIPDVNIFKRPLRMLPQFSFYFNQTLEKACNPGGYRSSRFLVICRILSMWHFEEKLPQLHCHYPLCYILVSSGKGSGRLSRLLGLLLNIYISLIWYAQYVSTLVRCGKLLLILTDGVIVPSGQSRGKHWI